jgi:hypothetical protein
MLWFEVKVWPDITFQHAMPRILQLRKPNEAQIGETISTAELSELVVNMPAVGRASSAERDAVELAAVAIPSARLIHPVFRCPAIGRR